MSTPIASLSIAARATLNMHSLNNEGGEGNQIQTRMVDIIDYQGKMHNVNAISGDMLKHVLMEHFYQHARAQQLSLCEKCEKFDTNRVGGYDKFIDLMNKDFKDDHIEFVNRVLKMCAIDDVAGFLVTRGRATPRKSTIEFGWVVGLPGVVSTNTYFHTKYNLNKKQKEQSTDVANKSNAQKEEDASNSGQNIFHRPASSGIYAFVCHLELARIGYNDIKQDYAIDENERQRRATLLLESLLHSFIELNGAMRSSQLPHLVALEGAITTSTGVIPAPLVSPLIGGSDDRQTYRTQLETIGKALNGNNAPSVTVQTFDSIGDFAVQMRQLIDSSSPFELAAGR